jgi:hypothetical protein
MRQGAKTEGHRGRALVAIVALCLLLHAFTSLGFGHKGHAAGDNSVVVALTDGASCDSSAKGDPLPGHRPCDEGPCCAAEDRTPAIDGASSIVGVLSFDARSPVEADWKTVASASPFSSSGWISSWSSRAPPFSA